MTWEEAAQIFDTQVERWRGESHERLLERRDSPIVYEIVAASGVRYQFEVEVFWDESSKKGNLRVIITSDDGQGWRLSHRRMRHDDFIKAPDGTFVGE
jgi:hypothetical protein